MTPAQKAPLLPRISAPPPTRTPPLADLLPRIHVAPLPPIHATLATLPRIKAPPASTRSAPSTATRWSAAETSFSDIRKSLSQIISSTSSEMAQLRAAILEQANTSSTLTDRIGAAETRLAAAEAMIDESYHNHAETLLRLDDAEATVLRGQQEAGEMRERTAGVEGQEDKEGRRRGEGNDKEGRRGEWNDKSEEWDHVTARVAALENQVIEQLRTIQLVLEAVHSVERTDKAQADVAGGDLI